MKEFKKWLEDKIHNQKIYIAGCQNDRDWQDKEIGIGKLITMEEIYNKFNKLQQEAQ